MIFDFFKDGGLYNGNKRNVFILKLWDIKIKKELSILLESYPTRVNWSDVVDFVNFDERLSAIDCLAVNTIGVSEGVIEFIPDNEPPLIEEIHSWIWAIRPDLSKELIALNISEDFRIFFNSYINNKMEDFWNHRT